MAQRELQVTALRPAASAMETYVRPEFERNQQAISRLTQSISATNDARSTQQAQIDNVKEAMQGGVADPNDRTGWSTDPVYVAARLEARGLRYGEELSNTIINNYETEFKLSARDDGADFDGWLAEQFSPASEALGDNVFLLSGANSVLGGLKAKMKENHLAHLDTRAKNETAANLGFTVDRILQGKQELVMADGATVPMNYDDKIQALDDYAVQLSRTTHYSLGEANKAIFDNILKTAEVLPPEHGLNYLQMFAGQTRYASGGDGAVNPAAAAAINVVAERLEGDLKRKQTAEDAAKKTAQTNAANQMSQDLVSALIDANNDGVVVSVSKEHYREFAEKAGMSATAVNKIINSMQTQFKEQREEHTTQRDAWFSMSTRLNSLRGNPTGIKNAYSDILKQVTTHQIHYSRIKEAQTLIKELETAAPVIKHQLLEQSMNTYIDALVSREDEWDTDANAEEKKYKDEWYGFMSQLINAHYAVDPDDKDAKPKGYPSANQLQAWAWQVEAQMNEKHADKKQVQAQLTADTNQWKDSITAAVNASATAPENDGLVNAAYINPTGAAGVRDWDGILDAEDIERDILPTFKADLLRDPLYILTAKDLPKDPKNVGATMAQYFDYLYGAGAFAKYWKKHGGILNESRYKQSLIQEDK